MTEDVILSKGMKEEKYETLLIQLEGLIADEDNVVANCANITAVIKQAFSFFWVGFYFVDGEDLVLGPFQGEVACTRIIYGQGVCGESWQKKKTIIVDDVNNFPSHIACSIQSKSEIVIPIMIDNKVVGVLDVDSLDYAEFNGVDKIYLERVALMVAQLKFNTIEA